jgi:hypothetical protein
MFIDLDPFVSNVEALMSKAKVDNQAAAWARTGFIRRGDRRGSGRVK